MSLFNTAARPFLNIAGMQLVSFPIFAAAATSECTAKVNTKMTDAQMKKIAKISMADALSTATELVGKSKLKKIMGKELEVEDHCLLYSFDLQLHSTEGIEEIFVDAISCKVLLQKHETPADEAAEKLADEKVASKKKK